MSKHPTFDYDVDYAERLGAVSDEAFLREVFEVIDRANQSPVYSLADAKAEQLRAEAKRRGRQDLYDRGFEAALAVAKGDRRYHRALQQLGVAA